MEVPFDDGFRPASADQPGRLIRQPPNATLPAGLSVIPNGISEEAAREAYDFTAGRPEGAQQWGTYLVLLGEERGQLQLERRGAEAEVEALAERLLCDFWTSSAGELLRADLQHVHGFGIWAVAGGEGLETAYHVDYAEMYRRRTNCIVPPLHAATLQVSPVAPEDIEGGTFAAHIDGLEHYKRHGYKCRWQPPSNGLPTSDWGVSDGWVYAPYTFRQATLSNGELPHACDKVKRWPEGLKRVVIGINTFGRLEGPVEHEVPQHSAAFRRTLKLELVLKQAGSKENFARMLLEHKKRKKNAAKRESEPGSMDSEEAAKEGVGACKRELQDETFLPLVPSMVHWKTWRTTVGYLAMLTVSAALLCVGQRVGRLR